MSGVMDISVATPTGTATTAIELSIFNARFLTQGTFNQDSGQWFVSAHALYPDVIAGAVRDSPEDVLADDYDLLAKVQHSIGYRTALSADLLRESGLRVGFADGKAEQLAATAILHGTAEGLTPARSPAVILPNNRLAAIPGNRIPCWSGGSKTYLPRPRSLFLQLRSNANRGLANSDCGS